MSKFIDLTGQRFGHLAVIELADDSLKNSKNRSKLWLCKCECGKTTYAYANNLNAGRVHSCGCLQIESTRARATHNSSETPLYKCWVHMKQRCLNQRCESFPDYGGRGITVCEDWKENFCSFQKWAVENGYHKDLTIERIDNNGNYCPENCKWSTRKEQQNNRRGVTQITYNGKTQSRAQWCEELGVSFSTVSFRVNTMGWDEITALTTPVRRKRA